MKQTKYICLEGGGGRGTVYLGVVKALQGKGLVPVPRISLDKDRRPGSIEGDPSELRLKAENAQGETSLLGVSGASAGAITSFLIALGCNAEEIAEVIERKIDVPGVNEKMGYFDSFLDPGLAYLSPNSRNQPS